MRALESERVKGEMNVSVCVCVGEKESKERRRIYVCGRAWERERVKRADEYNCACLRGIGREQKVQMNMSVRACVGQRENKMRR